MFNIIGSNTTYSSTNNNNTCILGQFSTGIINRFLSCSDRKMTYSSISSTSYYGYI